MARSDAKGVLGWKRWHLGGSDLPTGAKRSTKWGLKIKTDADMVPTKYKARLVARGFTQRKVDYEEVFAPSADGRWGV